MIKRNFLGKPIANYCKKETFQLREMFISLVVLAICIYTYFFKFVPHPYSGETYELERTVIQYLAFGTVLWIGRVIYRWKLDMPYLSFTEDRFFFDDDGVETGGYWTEVTNIVEVEIQGEPKRPRFKMAKFNPLIGMKLIAASGMPRIKQMGWEIQYGTGKRFLIDPTDVDVRDEDIMEIATTFWKDASQK